MNFSDFLLSYQSKFEHNPTFISSVSLLDLIHIYGAKPQMDQVRQASAVGIKIMVPRIVDSRIGCDLNFEKINEAMMTPTEVQKVNICVCALGLLSA